MVVVVEESGHGAGGDVAAVGGDHLVVHLHEYQPSLQSYADYEEGWVATLRQNVERLLTERGTSFVIIDSFNQVFGTALGCAREKHLREALRQLHRDGIVADEPKGQLMRFRVRPTGGGQSRLI